MDQNKIIRTIATVKTAALLTLSDSRHLQIMADTIFPHRHTLGFRVKPSTWMRQPLAICVQQKQNNYF